MFRSRLALFLLLSLPTLAQQFEVTPFEVKNVDGAVVVTVEVQASPKPEFQGTIRVPVEGVFINANAVREVSEANAFGSGLKLDLNGDGDTDDSYPLSQEGDKQFLGQVEVQPFIRSVRTQDTGQAEVHRLAPEAPGFLVYQADEYNIIAGADHHGVKAQFRELPNPFYQVILIEPCEGPTGPPAMQLEGANHFTYGWEPRVFSDGHSWMRVQWIALPLGSPQSFKITGEGHGFLVGRVNFSLAPGIRERRDPDVIPFAIPYDL